MDVIQGFIAQVQQWGNNLVRNSIHSFDGMRVKDWIRMVAIVGAYLLIRPYLMKWGAKIQEKQHNKEIDADEVAGPKAKVSPNVLRGHGGKEVEIPDSDSEGEAEGEATGAQWGKKARKRQRAYDKKLLAEVEERRRQLQEDDEDKDIMEYLVDYEEGKDGW
ncbi:protein trafficking Pga2 [Tricladium varicosporioides]|nr:protein trafficking Pga2 [Hymenoscyphus varicosporioides]